MADTDQAQALTVITGCVAVSRMRLAALPRMSLPTGLRRRRPITITAASTSVAISSNALATSPPELSWRSSGRPAAVELGLELADRGPLDEALVHERVAA